MKFLKPESFPDYELLDSGKFEKLERFGKYILSRPEPQALWDKSMTESEWERLTDATFKREAKSQEKGQWIAKAGMPERWEMSYPLTNKILRFKLALSSFKHVGVFPEQAVNWDYIYKMTSGIAQEKPLVLNLFAYTGIASLAAKAAGAGVVHVDAVKQVVSWAKDNMEISQLDGLRWMVDDAMKFVQRENRRGNVYQGIILDPPAYGRGPDGEKWLLEEQLNEMLKLCSNLLDTKHHFFILNLYSLGFSMLIAENLVKSNFKNPRSLESGELYLEDSFAKKLPLGIYSRFNNL